MKYEIPISLTWEYYSSQYSRKMSLCKSVLTCIIIFSGSLLFISCSKQKGNHYSISEDFKEWTLFQKGSYWIYKDDSLNTIDSTYITGTPIPGTDIISWNDNGTTNIIDELSVPLKSLVFKAWWLAAAPVSQSRLYIEFPDSLFTIGLIENLSYNTVCN